MQWTRGADGLEERMDGFSLSSSGKYQNGLGGEQEKLGDLTATGLIT